MIRERYQQVLENVHSAARSAGRNPDEIGLVTVTKGHPVERVQEVIAAGARFLGENYVEEGVAKIAACGKPGQVEWHMIGHVQSRKAAPVCEHFDWLHSLDRLKLAVRLDRFAGELGRVLPVLLECNVSGEESKYGFPAWQEENWPELLPEIERILQLEHIHVRGLMTMAPFFEEAEQARPTFVRLRRLRDTCAARFPQADWSQLSMGMSGDYEVAIQEGATLVRIGTAIMGPRPEN